MSRVERARARALTPAGRDPASRAAARKTVDSPAPLSRLAGTHAPIKVPHTVAIRCLRCLVRHTQRADPFIIKMLLYERARARRARVPRQQGQKTAMRQANGGVHFAQRIIN